MLKNSFKINHKLYNLFAIITITALVATTFPLSITADEHDEANSDTDEETTAAENEDITSNEEEDEGVQEESDGENLEDEQEDVESESTANDNENDADEQEELENDDTTEDTSTENTDGESDEAENSDLNNEEEAEIENTDSNSTEEEAETENTDSDTTEDAENNSSDDDVEENISAQNSTTDEAEEVDTSSNSESVDDETEGDSIGDGDGGTPTEDGEGGETGGDDGSTGDTGERAEDESEDGEEGSSIPVTTENNVSDGSEDENGTDGNEGGDGNEGDNNGTGGVTETGTTSATVSTGDATATGEIETGANNNKVSSELGSTTTENDLDTYTLNATGTNEANVDNTGTTSATTGENLASSSEGHAQIDTGDALSALNIANILNTNVINSTGFINLVNQLIEVGKSLDLRELFFPDSEGTLAEAGTCTLISCHAEDIIYNLEHLNDANISNDALIEAITGLNEAEGESAEINTGDAYGGANLMNVANTNIIDSNYLLLALNAMGTITGNLILPSEDLFKAFFGKPNAMQQALDMEGADSVNINADNLNNATTTNNINTVAETGLNQSTTTDEAAIQTGTGYAESNIVNEINKNLFGGDSMYLMIRIHGEWSGNVYGLPAGLTWERVPEGVLIYNEGAEITPSQIVTIDVDTYEANLNNRNDLVIDNNVDIHSLTGDNAIEAEEGSMSTGDAYAGANVMNIGNTNVIGRNWMMATLNIFGDLNGDISFGAADLWIGGEVESSETPVQQGSKLTYTYTIKNNGDLRASGIELVQDLSSAYTYYEDGERGTTRRESLDSIGPGETIEVVYEAFVNENLPNGTTEIEAIATLTSDEPDDNDEDNTETLTLVAERVSAPSSGGGGGGRSGGGGGGSSRNESPSSVIGKIFGAKANRAKADENQSSALEITKSSNFDDNSSINAGTIVSYSITIENNGDTAYDARAVDTLVNPIGSVINEESWDIGNISAGERIELTYQIAYDANTPSGEYTNTVRLTSYEEENATSEPRVQTAAHTLNINGREMAIGNVDVIGIFPNGNGKSSALITWETTKPADGQVFLNKKFAQSPYNPLALNYGYERTSMYLPNKTTKHYMFIPNLVNGTEYTYRIKSANGTHTAFGGDYTLKTPGLAPAPIAQTNPSPQASRQAAVVSEPKPKPEPAVTPAPTPSRTTFVFAPKKTTKPQPVPEPSRMETDSAVSSSSGSFVRTVAQKVLGFLSI